MRGYTRQSHCPRDFPNLGHALRGPSIQRRHPAHLHRSPVRSTVFADLIGVGDRFATTFATNGTTGGVHRHICRVAPAISSAFGGHPGHSGNRGNTGQPNARLAPAAFARSNRESTARPCCPTTQHSAPDHSGLATDRHRRMRGFCALASG